MTRAKIDNNDTVKQYLIYNAMPSSQEDCRAFRVQMLEEIISELKQEGK